MIGVSLSPVPSPSPGAKRLNGAVIRYVVSGGPADKGGLKVDDVIVTVGKKKVTGPADVVTAINRHSVGKPLDFGIARGNKQLKMMIYPAEMELIERN